MTQTPYTSVKLSHELLKITFPTGKPKLTLGGLRISYCQDVVPLQNPNVFLLQINQENDNSSSDGRGPHLGLQVPGILPGAGQPRQVLHLLPLHWFLLLLLPGHPGEGDSRHPSGQEKDQPLNTEEKPEEEGTLPPEETIS